MEFTSTYNHFSRQLNDIILEVKITKTGTESCLIFYNNRTIKAIEQRYSVCSVNNSISRSTDIYSNRFNEIKTAILFKVHL